ncbi:serine protease (plasmid) [Bradyrhizobium sp. 41S5]|uniref:S1 family peptidase n=1 Tax=Bradyrhizobium sp. 41S5 TaxID=1404443 RepID=UPI0015951F4E|nr:serine protease [Bradyrhizobium sp. 41S5]UFX49418.1 serine protease [Bradyrhizobium sp. 41S5]
MAIILPPPRAAEAGPGEISGLETIVLASLRPAFPIEGETIKPGPDNPIWSEPLAAAADVLARAVRATARLESSDRDLEFIGTAFAVTPRLAAVTGHIAQLMLQKGETSYWLNFASDGAHGDPAVGVKVRLIHPYFDFALLEMDRPVAEDNILSFSARMPSVKEKIALIGYPAKDPRSDPESLAAVFGNNFGKKLLMPGCIVDGPMTAKTAGIDVPALPHDASCVSGTSGAPVVQLSTGLVVGIHYAGWFLQQNFAIPAWELARDPLMLLSGLRFVGAETNPYWMPLWKEKVTILHVDVEAAQAEQPGAGQAPPKKKQGYLLKAVQINEIHALLVGAGFGSKIEIKTLFGALPVEIHAELPNASTESARLLDCLNDLNQRLELLDREDHTSLYVVISSAKTVSTKLKGALDGYLAALQAEENKLKQAQGLTSIATPKSASFRRVANAISKIGGKPVEFEGWTRGELTAKVGETRITFQNAAEGLQMLRGVAVGNSLRPFAIEERDDKFILRAEDLLA